MKQNGNRGRKKELPVWLPLAASFKNGTRKAEDAVPSGLFFLDIDEKGLTEALWNKVREENLIQEFRIVYFAESAGGGTHIWAWRTPGLSIEEDIQRLASRLGVSYDSHVTDLARCCFMVSEQYVRLLDPVVFEPLTEEQRQLYSASRMIAQKEEDLNALAQNALVQNALVQNALVQNALVQNALVQTTPTPPNLGGESAGVLTNGIWDNWFVQVGLDMSLMNPYGCNFSKVIPKGMTFGLNGALGKWFTPEFALRARVQWENGLIPNNGVEWLPPADDPKQNYKKGGLATIAFDAMLNLTNVAAGYDPERKWHTTGYVRAGIITQFVVGSASPLAGAGLEETYRLNDRLSLFGALGYQVSTSEGLGYGTTGMDVAAGSNGFFDIDFGIRYDLGRNRFYRDEETKRAAYSQPVAGHNWPRFAVNTLASVGVGFALKTALKKMVKEERPDHSDKESFPSGHATMAFAAARSIDKEFRKESIWIPIAGYAAATAIGVERVASDRHHWYDVVAGAGLGIASAELTWWLSDLLFPQRKYGVAIGTSGNTIDVSVAL